ncbi:MAG TPA: phenylalanine--tRNA ligase subunit beta, partial [Acidimicrobiales bacterium]|nr:phenylalanine--tRNA ligase subunit beta [Acidimicrobiales bacterium]
ADRIRQVMVDTGGPEPVQVVCGAFNFDVGAVVPFAQVGAVLPGDFEITERKMRGVSSFGMICSAAELRLGDDSGGILLLPDSLELGVPVGEALGIETDIVYDLAIEGNRPDANCVAGVARDAAARLGLPFAIAEDAVAEGPTPASDLATVVVESPDLCPRFTARVVTGVSVGPSPEWVARRLTLAGMRPINNVVDASNYVMLELGQPTHPYDLDRLPGRGLRVRRARPGEVLVTLDDVERRLAEVPPGTAASAVVEDCLICDAEDNPVGIAGIMGGASSEITEATTTVLLEAAFFAPMAIARSSKRLGLRTEASARFERGCDPLGIDRSVERFCELLGTGTVSPGTLDERAGLTPPAPIRVRTARVNAVLGTDLTDGQITGYLEPIGFTATAAGDGVHDVTPPSFRPDATVEIDVIEEVGRHHGYSNIPRAGLRSPHIGALTPYQRDRRQVRAILVGAGVDEAQTPPLVGPGDHERSGLADHRPIAAANAMIQEESVLRTSLLPGLLRALAFNAARRSPDAAFFEIGSVFRRPPADRRATGRDAALPDEHERLAVALAGDGGDAVAAKRLLDDLTEGLRLAGVALEASTAEGLHPGRTARVVLAGEPVGVVGEVDPAVAATWGIPGRVGWLDVDLVRLLAAPRRPLEQQPVSRFPSSDVDLAFVVAEPVPAAAVHDALQAGGGDLLVGVRLFDVYRGDRVPEGTRSLAFRLRFCALDRTLTDADVAEARQQAIDAVVAATGAQLRG